VRPAAIQGRDRNISVGITALASRHGPGGSRGRGTRRGSRPGPRMEIRRALYYTARAKLQPSTILRGAATLRAGPL